MAWYKVGFEPYGTPRYVYEVEASNVEEAMNLARDEFKMDIGYDRAKDFDLVDADRLDIEDDD